MIRDGHILVQYESAFTGLDDLSIIHEASLGFSTVKCLENVPALNQSRYVNQVQAKLGFPDQFPESINALQMAVLAYVCQLGWMVRGKLRIVLYRSYSGF